jgi:hypothetical protein
MKTLITLALALGTLSTAGTAIAAGPINARQLNQERRIDAGVRSGKLTHREAAQLRAQQRSISRQEDRMRARSGGPLTRRDKAVLHARQERANRAILAKKHNARRGPNHLKIR